MNRFWMALVSCLIAGLAQNVSAQEPPKAGDAPAAVETAGADQAGVADAAGLSQVEKDEAEELKSKDDPSLGLERLQDRVKSVGRKVFLKQGRHELAPFAGFSLNDSFYQHYYVGGSYRHYLSDYFSVGLFGATGKSSQTDNLKFVKQYATALPVFHPVKYTAGIEATFAPLYGKLNVLSESVVHHDLYVLGGLGMTGLGTGTKVSGKLTFNVGVGERVFLNRFMALNLEFRDSILADKAGPAGQPAVTNVRHYFGLFAGLGFFFPTDFEYRE